jgi:glycosyltransferase involved in cell wall biosynthesis
MIKIVCCFWNAEKYLPRCIKSLKNQTYQDFKVYLIDDVSTDNSAYVSNVLIKNDSRFKLTVNTEKKFKLKNLNELISTFDDEDIVVEVDGDDYLFSDDVLQKIVDTYIDPNIWLTNGSFMYSSGQNGFSSAANSDTVRTDRFTFSHLRTWKTFLWKSIPLDYFMDLDGTYFKSAADVAYTIPLLELAGEEHYKFNSEILYVYNEISPYNDHKKDSASGGGLTEQTRCANIIRNKPKLQKLIKQNEGTY